MLPTFVVLSDLSGAAQTALTYTSRLAALLAGRVVLLHVYQDPLLEPESMMVAAQAVLYTKQKIRAELVAQARQLPVPAEVEISLDTLSATVTDVVQRHRPLLLAIGREQPENLLDRLLPHQAASLLRAARYPLLLVPENRTASELPQRVVVAADDHDFQLTAPSAALLGLLRALQPTTTVVHVASGSGPSKAQTGLAAVQRIGFGTITNNSLYEIREEAPADGILHAATELRAQLIVVLARPHSVLGELFHRSVTAQVLRRSPVPVLVLPTAA
ncbi:universal stress protein [Hymenobacter koreensis]|uniref:UspA domain-containing protein n=1 Tax=Hymenobacter koreensis TaxID=1084523 RepID=A0ABP8J681_9BACT